MFEWIDKLEETGELTEEEFVLLLKGRTKKLEEYAAKKARTIADSIYGKDIYIRGLIEFTNYCKNDCYYCGIQRSNKNALRYRLTEEEILQCCAEGYQLGFRTFVLQGGEDPYYTDERVVELVKKIKKEYPDCALTLSIGEKPYESYEKFYKAGADRYLLRHETADLEHYGKLHPEEMSQKNRMECLRNLKQIGFQTGCGFMVGSPFQTVESIAKDFVFIHQLKPDMVGIGPFIPHKDTPLKDYEHGSLEKTIICLAIVRLLLPKVLLPATTALSSISENGREEGLKAGGNVIMPNLSPMSVRKKYSLYDNKAYILDEDAKYKNMIEEKLRKVGFEIEISRGDNPDFRKKL